MLAFTGSFWKTFTLCGRPFCCMIWTGAVKYKINLNNKNDTTHIYEGVQKHLVAPLVYDHCQFLVSDLCLLFPEQGYYWIRQHLRGYIVTSNQTPNRTSLLLCYNPDTEIASTRRIRSELRHKYRFLVTELIKRKTKTNGHVNFVECSCIAMGSGRYLPRAEQTRSTSRHSRLEWLYRLIPRAITQR